MARKRSKKSRTSRRCKARRSTVRYTTAPRKAYRRRRKSRSVNVPRHTRRRKASRAGGFSRRGFISVPMQSAPLIAGGLAGYVGAYKLPELVKLDKYAKNADGTINPWKRVGLKAATTAVLFGVAHFMKMRKLSVGLLVGGAINVGYDVLTAQLPKAAPSTLAGDDWLNMAGNILAGDVNGMGGNVNAYQFSAAG